MNGKINGMSIRTKLHERSLVIVKPDGVQRGLVGEIIKRFESRGFKVSGLKMVKPSSDHVKKHYLATKEQLGGMGNKSLENLKQLGLDPVKVLGTDDPMKIGKMINDWNFEFLSSAPVVAVVFEGPHAVEMGRKIVGNTLPFKAEIGTIRGDFSMSTSNTIVHSSEDVKAAKREIAIFFKPNELFNYNRPDLDFYYAEDELN